ncbi:MAG: cation diffusion facilitator family transporter [Chloroflexi bacterium]|nr:cation diffusion facilitator family transporter [Chloroflexota bacterium]
MDLNGTTKRIVVAMVVTLLFMIFEAAAGVFSNSLALVSDAAHNFTDVIALGLSLYALRLSTRPANASKTYGYHRAGILVALVNAGTLIAIALLIFYEAWRRIISPPVVREEVMLVVALIALGVNGGTAYLLHRASATDLNIRSAFIHMAGDALSTLGVIVASVAIQFTGLTILDPLASILIGVIIATSSWNIVREGVNVLLEGTPSGIDMDTMVKDILDVQGVRGVHDLHAWSITPTLRALSAHVLTDDITIRRGADIQREINLMLVERYDIAHTAIQLECEGCTPDALYCEMGANGNGEHEHIGERRSGVDRRRSDRRTETPAPKGES